MMICAHFAKVTIVAKVTIPYITEPLVAGSVSPSGMQSDFYIAEVFQDTVARNWDVVCGGLTGWVNPTLNR